MGLQLSYLGTVGIILFNKNIRQVLDKINFKKQSLNIKNKKQVSAIISNIKDIIAVTLSANVMILPIIIYHFNMIGMYFVITNIFASVIIGPIMVLSVIFIIVSFINLEVAKFISFFLLLGIEGLIQISNLSNLPFSKIYVSTPSLLSIMFYYLGILIVNQLYVVCLSKHLTGTKKRIKNLMALAKFKLHQKREELLTEWKNMIVEKNIKRCISKIYKIMFVVILFSIISIGNKQLNVYFLDVGQGDSCFIVTPNKKTILIDGGGSTSETFDVGKDTLIPYLLDRGFTKIDYVFISHFDQDHVGGILPVIEELKIGQIYIAKQEKISENYEVFKKIVQKKKLKVKEVIAGNTIIIEDLQFHILWPIDQQISENQLNNNAIVMKLQYKKFSMLFTGDIEKIAEEGILNQYKNNLNSLEATVLKVAHHGSKSSSTEEFLKAVNSKVAIISVGENNLFGHPNVNIIKRLKSLRMQIFRTDIDGEISMRINCKGEVKMERFASKQ